jgi:hypothetical protein
MTKPLIFIAQPPWSAATDPVSPPTPLTDAQTEAVSRGSIGPTDWNALIQPVSVRQLRCKVIHTIKSHFGLVRAMRRVIKVVNGCDGAEQAAPPPAAKAERSHTARRQGLGVAVRGRHGWSQRLVSEHPRGHPLPVGGKGVAQRPTEGRGEERCREVSRSSSRREDEVIKMQSALFALVLAAGILVGCAAPFGPPLAAGCTAIGCTPVQATVEHE